MSIVRFNAGDIVVKDDKIGTSTWSNNTNNLQESFTSSLISYPSSPTASSAFFLEVFNSMSEMKRMLDQGALYINGNRVNDAETSLTKKLFIRNNFMVIRVGSKKYHLSVLK